VTTRAVNISREFADVYCGRGSPLGNTFTNGRRSRAAAIRLFREDFAERIEMFPDFRAYVLSLQGKHLGCHCKPRPCHLDCVVEWIEAYCPKAAPQIATASDSTDIAAAPIKVIAECAPLLLPL